jgi:hypothetical protein
LAARRGEPVRLPLDPDPATLEPLLDEDRRELAGGIRTLAIHPDADVGQDRGELGLAQVGGTGEEDEIARPAQDEALEEAEAEAVVAREPVHALLLEQEEPVEPGLGHGGERAGLARGELGLVEMQHGGAPPALRENGRVIAHADPGGHRGSEHRWTKVDATSW